jgi:hypothetical protein
MKLRRIAVPVELGDYLRGTGFLPITAEDDPAAERMERYRQRHARKLARKAARRGHQGPPTVETWAALTPTREDWNAWFVTTDDEPSQTIGTN